MKLFIKLFLLFTFFINTSYSFSFNNSVGAAFETDEIIVNVADNCDNLGVTDSELLSIVNDSLNQFWNTVATSKLVLKLGSLVTLGAAFYTEEICTISGNDCIPNTNLIVSTGITISCNENNVENVLASEIFLLFYYLFFS